MAAAQRLGPQQRIRVTAPEVRLQQQPGRLVWLDRDSLVFSEDTRRWVVPRPLLTAIDSSRGRHGHALTGLVVGAVAGYGIGMVLFPSGSNACTGSGNYEQVCQLIRAGAAVGGAGLGALVGALIRTDRWAALSPASVEFAPPPRGVTP